MSEEINNREYRQKVLKEIIMELHEGKTVDQVKERFDRLIQGVSASEISQMEQNLIMEGLPVEEVQRLCDVHAAVFKGSIEDIHKPQEAYEMPGHPIHTFKLENRALERLMDNNILPALKQFEADDGSKAGEALLQHLKKLMEIEQHYSRKENILFPFLEKYGITGPPQVMWGVDDEIRAEIRESINKIQRYDGNRKEAAESVRRTVHRVKMILRRKTSCSHGTGDLTEDEWLKIAEDSNEIGYTLVQPAGKWQPRQEAGASQSEQPVIKDRVLFD